MLKPIELIGITEGGDATLHQNWIPWVKENKPAILITKNPEGLIDLLNEHDLWYKRILIHCVITGLGGTILEPNVPNPEDAIKAYHYIHHQFEYNYQTILRVDPIIPTSKGMSYALNVLKTIKPDENQRIRISFLDNYDHVKRRHDEAGIPRIPYDFHAPLFTRKAALDELQALCKREIEVCAEPGLKCSGCISDLDCQLLGVEPSTSTGRQRKLCMCLAQKQELIPYKQQCNHKCLYCYWRN